MSKAIEIHQVTFLSEHVNSYRVRQLQRREVYVSKRHLKRITAGDSDVDASEIKYGTQVQLHIPGWLADKCDFL